MSLARCVFLEGSPDLIPPRSGLRASRTRSSFIRYASLLFTGTSVSLSIKSL